VTSVGPDADARLRSFLTANQPSLERLSLTVEVVAARGQPGVRLVPGPTLGAVPLRDPITRRPAGGVLVEPRFGWSSTGQVLAATGFRVAPALGGLPLVPGSAREVPPYILAGPVVDRLAKLVDQLTRGFVEVSRVRESPRGRVDWIDYARRRLPRAEWTRLPCSYSDLADDPDIVAAARWTLSRIAGDLERLPVQALARTILQTVEDLLNRLGSGPQRRPESRWIERTRQRGTSEPWLQAALEGMAWIAEERGLGGATILDGLAWSMEADALWEVWVESFLDELAPRLAAKLKRGRTGETVTSLRWTDYRRGLSHLIPDAVLSSRDRAIVVDAKYKWHLTDVTGPGLVRGSRSATDDHRHDIHQVLAYAATIPERVTDVVLAYPESSGTAPDRSRLPFPAALVAAGLPPLRLHLCGLPFGFATPSRRAEFLSAWQAQLSGLGEPA
jgi:hypothetical protein